MGKLKLYVISDTHWDREWYQTFQNYRYRLVRAMDDLIQGLEKDEEYKVFHLDGQTIVLEDYLEIRPEMEERLTKLIKDGRIVIGPWYVMPDEYLVSGEALIKNLQMGHKICRQYGTEPMKSGYVTDIFGHNSQFPQILNGFDIHSSVLYRGIGDYEKDLFRWQSPDGSEVLAAKLEAERSYSNFYFAVRWPFEGRELDEQDAVQRMKELVSRAEKMAATDRILMMDGVDHCAMEPDLPKMLRLFEKEIPEIEFVHGQLDDYFEGIDRESLELIKGALYHIAHRGINNQVLKNVLSSMVHIKQANDECETYLSTVSEPLNAFCEMNMGKLHSYRKDDYSLAPRDTFLDKAWKYLIKNQPHDSICGCSLTDVHRDNEYRYRQSKQMAEISAADCLYIITENIRCTGEHQDAVLLYNPSQLPIEGVHVFSMDVEYHENANRRFYDSRNCEIDVQILDETEESIPVSRMRRLVEMEHISRLCVAADIKIPAYGYTVIYCDNYQNERSEEKKSYGYVAYCPPKRLQGSLMVSHNEIDNGVLRIRLNEKGLLDVTRKENGHVYRDMHLLEDRSDVGEGWNWKPSVYDSVIYNENNLEQFSVLSDGPLCTVWKIVYNMRIPKKAAPSLKWRSEDEYGQKVVTVLTVLKDRPVLYFKTEIKNEVQNHRMRVLFPTNSPEEFYFTKTPFDFTKWDVHPEDDSDSEEAETRVHPSQGISRIGTMNDAVSVYAKGLYETEVTDNEEKAFALTLFRASQSETGTAHPLDIQMQRRMTFEYAVSLTEQTPTGTILEGEQYRSGIHSFRFEQNRAASELEGCGRFLKIKGKGFQKIVSHISEREGSYTIRVYDISGIEEKIEIVLPQKINSAEYVDLKGEVIAAGEFDENKIKIDCPPHKIVTVLVKAQSLSC